MERKGEAERQTKETHIHLRLDLDGRGEAEVATGIGFFDHLLTALFKHAWFDVTLHAQGDLHRGAHHTVEDVGIVLGQALDQALGERKGIHRFGHALLPMDEALVLCAIDLSGRGGSFVVMPTEGVVGGMELEALPEFFKGMALSGRLTLHLNFLSGENKHHIWEAAFKACGVALRQAVAFAPRLPETVPSTKGKL